MLSALAIDCVGADGARTRRAVTITPSVAASWSHVNSSV